MKITTFNPQIMTKDAAPLVELFEALGFEKRHNQEGVGELNVKAIRMKDENSFYLDIAESDAPMPHDMVSIRMNVDDFEEAYALLTAKGFRNFYGDDRVVTKTSKSAIMIAPSGFMINLIEHVKK